MFFNPMNKIKWFLVLMAGWVLAISTSSSEHIGEAKRMDSEFYFCMSVLTIVYSVYILKAKKS
jgi:hypothetical protein